MLLGPAIEDRQRIGGELARELGSWERLTKRRSLARPHRSEAILAPLLRSGADRRECGARQRIWRRFLSHGSKIVDQPAGDSSGQAAGHQVGNERVSGPEAVAMDV